MDEDDYELLNLTVRGPLLFLLEVWSEDSSENSFSSGRLFMGRFIAFGGEAVRPNIDKRYEHDSFGFLKSIYAAAARRIQSIVPELYSWIIYCISVNEECVMTPCLMFSSRNSFGCVCSPDIFLVSSVFSFSWPVVRALMCSFWPQTRYAVSPCPASRRQARTVSPVTFSAFPLGLLQETPQNNNWDLLHPQGPFSCLFVCVGVDYL